MERQRAPWVASQLVSRKDMFKYLLLVVLTALIVVVSRRVVLRPWTHGFYRMFAWELTAVILYLNVDNWFSDPFSAPQLASWGLLIMSLVVLVWSVVSLQTVGKPDARNEDPTRIGIEKTTVLVAVGIYRYIRHPLYASVFLLAWGAALKTATWLSVILAALVTALVFVTAKVEEKEDIRQFGENYLRYMKKTRMFLPFLL
jgi:protein-S-isoprenylcysteine O-methyltransferase Ste14